jgi:hypothetical protein
MKARYSPWISNQTSKTLNPHAGFFKTIGALPEDQVIERRKGSVHDDSKLHKMDTIAEDGSANGQGAVAIEMGSAVTSAPSGESKQLRGASTSSANRHSFLTAGPSGLLLQVL